MISLYGSQSQPVLPQCPEKVQSYDDAITLIQTASNICHLSKTLLKHLQFQLIKAQRDVSVMKTKCDATEDYFRDVISLVAESGYSVSITPGREPKVTVKKVSGNTGESSILAISPSSLNPPQFPLFPSHHKDTPPLSM